MLDCVKMSRELACSMQTVEAHQHACVKRTEVQADASAVTQSLFAIAEASSCLIRLSAGHYRHAYCRLKLLAAAPHCITFGSRAHAYRFNHALRMLLQNSVQACFLVGVHICHALCTGALCSRPGCLQ